MRRLLTAAIGVPLALLATFGLPPWGFFVVVAVVVVLGSVEYARLLRPHAPHAPLWLVPVWVVPVAAGGYWALSGREVPPAPAWLLVAGLFVTVGLGVLLLSAYVPAPEVPAALGVLAFGIPYFALPIATLTALQRLDPWLLFLLWQIAYSEIWVTQTLWPDFRRRELFEAILDFQRRERRYGGVGGDESAGEQEAQPKSQQR